MTTSSPSGGYLALVLLLMVILAACQGGGVGLTTPQANTPTTETATTLSPAPLAATGQPGLTPALPSTVTTLPVDTPAPTLSPPMAAVPTTPEISLEATNAYYKGLTYVAAGLPEEAMTSFSQAITLAPGYDLAYLERGKLYLAEGQLAPARTDFHYALELTADPTVKAEAAKLLEQVAGRLAAATATPPALAPVTPTIPPTLIPAPPVEAHLDEPFALPIGATAWIKDADFRLTFWQLVEDSRCPSQVNCVWSGQAQILVQVQPGQIEPMTFEMNNIPSKKQDVILVAGYEIRWLTLEPHPQNPDQPIPPEAYRATFSVTRR